MDIAEQEERFTEWLSAHAGIVHHVVNGFASGEDRNDLMQEILLAVWRSIPVFRSQAKPTTYLYRVCHNAALLWVRTEKNYRRRVEKFGAFSPGGFVAASSDTADERLSKVYGAIHALKPVDRSLMLLLLDGLSYREIAEVLGLSESNVGVKINRIKNQLSQTLKENENEHR